MDIAPTIGPHSPITHLINLSNTGVITVLGDRLSFSKFFGFAMGAASLWLAVRLRTSNWPIGIINDLFFLVLFWSSALYANAVLQILYIALGIWGWWAWLRGTRERTPIPVSHTSFKQWVNLSILSSAGTLLLTALLSVSTNSTMAFWDATTTVLSVAATWGQCMKKVESWYLWLVVDAIYIQTYATQHLGLTSLLYVCFFGMGILGVRDWRTALSTKVISHTPERSVGQ